MNLPCSFFSVSQNFCNSVKYLSNMKTFERPKVAIVVVHLCGPRRRRRRFSYLNNSVYRLSQTLITHTGTRDTDGGTGFWFSAQALPGTRICIYGIKTDPEPEPESESESEFQIYIKRICIKIYICMYMCMWGILCSCNKWSDRKTHENK